MTRRLFVPLDVTFTRDPKILAAGANAELLYIRSLALCKETQSGGDVSRYQLAPLALGITGRPATLAQRLVDVVLWVPIHDGWHIAAWHSWNISVEEIEQKSDAKRLAGVRGNHKKWGHPGKVEDCPTCRKSLASAIAETSHNGSHVRNGSVAPAIAEVSPEVEVETEEEITT